MTLKKLLLIFAMVVLNGLGFMANAETTNPAVVSALIDRIGGQNASTRFETVVDPSLSTSGKDVFVITSSNGKPCIKGSSVIAVTTGLNWYLNHHAHINLAWNCLTTNLNAANLPVPTGEERHECTVDNRYYLNYCTYSYSCAMWTEERWMQEIDWMALHGINMPLMLVGLDVIWHDIYTSPEFGYTTEEIGKYIAGPAFQAWWGMTNLEGHGGPNPKWWYERQRAMCTNMLSRMRSLGMEPVLPGFYGTVPSNLKTKMTGKGGYSDLNSGGDWQGYKAPGMLSATDTKFDHLAQVFYDTQKKVMGTSRFYSMDLCHEGGTAPNCGRAAQAKGIMKALDANCGNQSVWVIQAWGANPASDLMNAVAKGRLMILDLFGENSPNSWRFGNHDFVYCMLLNFGGRTGLHGRFDNLVKNYNDALTNRRNQLKGIGATPEGIENNPVMYDALFELPWTNIVKKDWVADYTTARFGAVNQTAVDAMQKLMESVYNCPGGQQGTSEPVILARPSLNVTSVSSWSTSSVPYDHTLVIEAASQLLSQADKLEGNNFEYDLLDVTRQALSDYAYFLLQQLASDYRQFGGTSQEFKLRKDAFLALIDDIDELLGSHHSYRLGNWTEMSRAIVTEEAARAAGATDKDADWLEYDNLRRQISTWSDFDGSLQEYSNREWNGMLRDYYKPRWVEFLNALASGSSTSKFTSGYWYNKGCEWIKNTKGITYTSAPVGNTKTLASEKFAKYFMPLPAADGNPVFAQRHIKQEINVAKFHPTAYRGHDYTIAIPEGTTATLAIDANNDGNITDNERSASNTIAIPANAATSDVKAVLSLSDGTIVEFRIALADEILEDRTVSVQVSDACKGQGTVKIVGQPDGTTSVTNREKVTILATPKQGFDFAGWTITANNETSNAGTLNPLTYYGAADATFTASFVENLWGIPNQESANEIATVKEYNSYVSAINCTQGDKTSQIYAANTCPDQYFNLAQGNINASRGSSFSLGMTDAGGMAYCYMTAYIDLNRDGDFDDEGELIEVRGTKGTTTSGICNNPINVLLPYDMPTGLTHLRIRFDGAWKSNITATGSPVPAKADLTRMTYEIPVYVSPYALGTTHVVIRSADETMGTVRNITGTSGEDISVPSGTEIQPEAFPKPGYKFVKWIDKYGRVVSTTSSFKIIPAENSEFTAIFKKNTTTANAGSYNVEIEETEGGLARIIALENVGNSADGILDLTSANIPESVTGLEPAALRGNAAIRRILLPARNLALDFWTLNSRKGDGIQNSALIPQNVIPGAGPWQMTLMVETDGSSFNQWGSALLATGTNALADNYQNNFQFYLSKAGNLTMKLNNSDNRYSFAPNVGKKFTIVMVNDGKGNISTTLTAENGATDTKTQTGVKLDDIKQFATAIPAGITIKALEVSDPTLHSQPLKGCAALTDITVDNNNTFYADKNGILYLSATNRICAYPEGRLVSKVFRLKNLSTGKYAYATPSANTAGDMTADNNSDRRVLTESAANVPFAASLWRLVPIEGGYKVCNVNSNRFFGGKAGDHNRLEMPASPTQWHGTYNYDGNLVSGSGFQLSIKTGNYTVKDATAEVQLDNPSSLSNSHKWLVEEVTGIPVTVSSANWKAVALPVPVFIPSSDDCYSVTGHQSDCLTLNKITPGTPVRPGEGLIIARQLSGTVIFPIAYDEETETLPGNLLVGTLLKRTGFSAGSIYTPTYTQDFQGFTRNDSGATEANSAYLPSGSLTEQLQRFILPSGLGTTAISILESDELNRGPLYDLLGRKVTSPTRPGLYIDPRGNKILLK